MAYTCTCVTCGKSFDARNATQSFCSMDCNHKYQQELRGYNTRRRKGLREYVPPSGTPTKKNGMKANLGLSDKL